MPHPELFIFSALVILVLILVRVFYYKSKYKKRYEACLKDLDETIFDIIKATRIILTGRGDLEVIDRVVVETIMKNLIIQRIFTRHEVLYNKHMTEKWITNRVQKVKRDKNT